MATAVTFNGYDLTQDFIMSGLVRQFMPRDVSQIDVPGMDGALFSSARYSPIKISMEATVLGENPQDRSDALRRLASVLAVGEPSPLSISDDDGKFYLAIPSGGDISRYISAETFPLEFTALDPAMYGSTVTVEVPSGGSATFTVGGNYPTMPSISVSATRDSASTVYGLRLDSSAVLDFPTGTDSAVQLEIDCANRTADQDGDTVIPTLGSDWFVLEPGEHEVENYLGAGAATLSYVERWV